MDLKKCALINEICVDLGQNKKSSTVEFASDLNWCSVNIQKNKNKSVISISYSKIKKGW